MPIDVRAVFRCAAPLPKGKERRARRFALLHHFYGTCRHFKTEKPFRLVVDVCQRRIYFLFSQEALILLLNL